MERDSKTRYRIPEKRLGVDAKVMVFHAQPRETERLAAKHEAGLLRPTFSDRALGQ